MDTLSFEDFKKMQLVVGRVVSVENHPDADKLFIVQVDLGSETRQLVAGLRPWYPADRLMGRSVVIVANLAPVKIRGVDSNGMLLAAQDGENVVILTTEVPVSPGSIVR